MKKLISLSVVLSLTSWVWATPYDFKGCWVDVDAWVGAGANETILVVDWNRMDHGDATLTESHAFGFRWDGDAYESEMLQAFNDAGVFTLTTGYGGAFIYNIEYNDGSEIHKHIEEGSWNLASTADPSSRWGTWGNSEWDFNTAGIDAEPLADGQFEGLNAIMWFNPVPDYADTSLQLDIPFVPEPATLGLLCLGSLLGMRRRVC